MRSLSGYLLFGHSATNPFNSGTLPSTDSGTGWHFLPECHYYSPLDMRHLYKQPKIIWGFPHGTNVGAGSPKPRHHCQKFHIQRSLGIECQLSSLGGVGAISYIFAVFLLSHGHGYGMVIRHNKTFWLWWWDWAPYKGFFLLNLSYQPPLLIAIFQLLFFISCILLILLGI